MTQSENQVPTSRALNRVIRGNLCAGCGGCALVAPGKVLMQMEPPGFLRPVQTADLSDTEEETIARICPGLGQTVEAKGRKDDVLWGPYLEMHTGWSTDETLRHAASSGGAISAILTHLLSTGRVDAVVQTAASPTVPIANVTVISETTDQVRKAAGSRYAPSAPLANLGEHLDSDKRFAFVGKPCDVAALRALAKMDPRVDERIPFMLSFFCAGVPSQTGAVEVLEKMGTDLASTVEFRYRGNGWPGDATATDKNGHQTSISYFESWGRVLSTHVQLRCKICADGAGKAADIVCADAWETDGSGYPLFEDRKGVSLIVTRTAKGQQLFSECQNAHVLETGTFRISDLADIQPGQVFRRRTGAARLLGLRLLGRPFPRYRGLNLIAAARTGRATLFLKSFAGTLRRGLTGRLD